MKGDAEGLGNIRKRELISSCEELGIPKEYVTIIDRETLKDGMNQKWNIEEISQIVSDYAKKNEIHLVVYYVI